MHFIDRNSFDTNLSKLLKNKKSKNVASGRYDMEGIELEKKADFVIKLVRSLKVIKGITYKILFWEKDEVIKDFITLNYPNRNFDFKTPYRNGKLPGALFIDELIVDEQFLKILLINHFNYELGEDPSLSIRVQICINQQELISLFDIYDDRGFDIYQISCSSLIVEG